MANKQDELTDKMHSEFKISELTDQKHATWMALEEIAEGNMSESEAMAEYGITDLDIFNFKPEWLSLKTTS